MTTKEFSAIAVKLAGIVCLIVVVFRLQHVVSFIYHYFQVLEERPEDVANFFLSVQFTYLLGFGIVVLAGLCLLFAGDRVGSFITRSESEIPFPQSTDTVFRIGIALIGVWVIAVAFPELVSICARALIEPNETKGYQSAQHEMYWPDLLSAVVKTVIGVVLFLGARGIVGLHQFLRQAGKHRIKQYNTKLKEQD